MPKNKSTYGKTTGNPKDGIGIKAKNQNKKNINKSKKK